VRIHGWLGAVPPSVDQPRSAKQLAHAAFAVRDSDGLVGLRARAGTNRCENQRRRESAAGGPALSVWSTGQQSCDFRPRQKVTARARQAAGARLCRSSLWPREMCRRSEGFYAGKLGFGVFGSAWCATTGKVMTCFMRGNHEHHNLACFYQDRQGRRSSFLRSRRMGTCVTGAIDCRARYQADVGPGRHGPGNNLFIFVVDPDDNLDRNLPPEIEVIHDRAVSIGLTQSKRSTSGAADCCARRFRRIRLRKWRLGAPARVTRTRGACS